jgi:diguanylate cyclase (GGDEF)-like protein/PAS domain S-box-containing protein
MFTLRTRNERRPRGVAGLGRARLDGGGDTAAADGGRRAAVGTRIVDISDRRHGPAGAEPAPRGRSARDPAAPWRARFRTLLDLARDAFVETDGRGMVTEWNRQAELLFGWPRDEVVGRSVEAFLIPRRFRGRLANGLGLAPEGSAAERTAPRQLWLNHREGHEVHVSGAAYVMGVGAELRIGGFMHEIGDEVAAEEALAHAYLHDSLTGLPNRTQFTYRLAYALASSRARPGSVSVLVLDLDRFKAVNEAMGHEVGDELLVAVAARLVHIGGAEPGGEMGSGPTGVPELVARLGGDEFLVLFHGEEAEDQALAYAERVLSALATPVMVGGGEIFVSASIGIASTAGFDIVEPTPLLSNADAAMYQAKRRGGRRIEVFGEALRLRVLDRMNTECGLHRALERRELELHYQQVVSVRDGRPTSREVLLRWDHPDHGLVPPDRFIPVAEESGLIIPIGTWVLEQACRQLAGWQAGAGRGQAMGVAVNLSARQIDHPDIVATVERALADSGVDPGLLILEITESALMDDARSALQVLRALKDLGVALAIDDFGTGYSSLAYLQRFPLDLLKIDKTFVAGLGAGRRAGAGGSEIVGAVVELAHALGLRVVAEGVESERQLAELRRLGCDFAQGYLFSRPLPASQIAVGSGRLGHPVFSSAS